MRKSTIVLTFASVFLAGVVAVPALYARDDHGSSGSMGGMMGDGNRDDMMGMMGMMRQMSQMMDHCNGMMGDSRPNEQWRKNAPLKPEDKE